MYYPQAPREPSGCVQSLVITRLIMGILLIPMAIIIGAIIYVLIIIWALDVSPFLALAVLGAGVFLLFAVIKWESRRVARDNPPEE